MRRQKTKRKKAHYRKQRNKGRRRKRQCKGFLNRYDFAYAGRDTVNQAAKVAPVVIKADRNDINSIAEQRINQIVSKGGAELERVLPKILRRGIKDVYQTPFRLL